MLCRCRILPNVAPGLVARPGRRRRHHRQPRHTPTLEPRFRRWRHALRRQLRSYSRIAPQRARVFCDYWVDGEVCFDDGFGYGVGVRSMGAWYLIKPGTEYFGF